MSEFFAITVAGVQLKEMFPERRIETQLNSVWMSICQKPKMELSIFVRTRDADLSVYLQVNLLFGETGQVTYRNVSIPRDAWGTVKSAILRNRLRKAIAQVLVVGSNVLVRNATYLDNMLNEMATTSFEAQNERD